jgi:hypothetical protein
MSFGSSDNISLPAAAAFTIAEQSGQQRTVTLTGRGLPYRPFSLSNEQRVTVTWLPGSPEGTGTVLGPQLNDTVLTGKWKDLFIAPSGGSANQTVPIALNGMQVTSVDDAITLMESIADQGQEVLVSWGSKQRLGYLKKFDQHWDDFHDCAWDMSFEWISDGSPTVASVLDDQSGTSDTNAQADAQMSALQAAIVPPFPVPAAFVAALQGASQQAQNGVDNMVNAGNVQAAGAGASTQQANSSTLATVSTPNNVAARVAASASAAIDGAQAVIDTLDAQPARVLVAQGSPNAGPVADLPYGQIVAAEVYARTAQLVARTLRRTAAIRRAVIVRMLESDLIGVYIARDGDDLRGVADQFYGSRLQWRPLLIFNELSGTALSAGQVVLVPRLTNGVAA